MKSEEEILDYIENQRGRLREFGCSYANSVVSDDSECSERCLRKFVAVKESISALEWVLT